MTLTELADRIERAGANDLADTIRRLLRVERAARKLWATPADLPDLWNAPGYPELTTNQLLSIAEREE